MIRIAISPAAHAAIAATLPGSVAVEPQRAPNGDYLVWLDPAVVNRLAAMRGPACRGRRRTRKRNGAEHRLRSRCS
jgi:hypothetical protein